ncbi:MAG: gamma-glutamyl-gamma-aminobutyrate hydrolase family protein [Firmicutes bacterium]|nr:gamma-glutamyl-gamma-aminobutyrate hydrolase family protein [Bacillota bacterium]
MKPFIGIMERPEKTRGGNDVTVMYDHVRSVVVKMGGIPIGISAPTPMTYVDRGFMDVRNMNPFEIEDLKAIIDLCSGVIFPGGDQVLDYDLKAMEYCYQNQIPTLGICLGMQTMGYLFGGEIELVRKSEIEHRLKKTEYAHPVRIKKDSKLYQIVKKEVIRVNSFHKSQVVHPKLDGTAYAPDGVLEAIECKKHPFFIGVQWHPESMFTYDMVSQKLFQSFFESVKKRVAHETFGSITNCFRDSNCGENNEC